MTVTKYLVLAIAIAGGLPLSGCDSAHMATIKIKTSTSNSVVQIEGAPSRRDVLNAFEELAHKLDYPCHPPSNPQTDVLGMSLKELKEYPNQSIVLSCGPAWYINLSLYQKDYGYDVIFSEMNPGWSVPPHFCKTKKEVFAFFTNRFPDTRLKSQASGGVCSD